MKKKSILILLLFFIGIGILFSFFPGKIIPSFKSAVYSLMQFLMIIPAIIFITGIFSVLITHKMIEKNFGKDTNIYSALKAIALGAIMSTGPFYLSFPMAKTLLNKGARISIVMIFVSSWNGISIIDEIAELHYMGILFMSIRCSLTAFFILLSGYAAEYIFKLWKK